MDIFQFFSGHTAVITFDAKYRCTTTNVSKPDSAVGLFSIGISVTKLGDLLDFGQLFKAFGNN